ncbi:MAG: hypothetical protein ACP5UN_02400 [Candidatus Micrarchaeia archaeon]
MEKRSVKKNIKNENKNNNNRERTEDLLLLAFVFLGLGFGIAYNQIAAGLLIGFGVGMIFREFAKPKSDRNYNIKLPLGVAAYILILIGVYFVVLGIALIESYLFLYPFNTSYLLIAIGIIFLILYAIERRKR